MSIEIERKFLVVDSTWRQQISRSQAMDQAYLGASPGDGEGRGRSSVRVRVAGDQAHLNIKARTPGPARLEFEYPIPLADAELLLAQCANHRIEKIRHWVPYGDVVFEVDEFLGANQGLVVAEVELAAVDQEFAHPAWLGAEVTQDPRYYNNELALRPWTAWKKHAR